VLRRYVSKSRRLDDNGESEIQAQVQRHRTLMFLVQERCIEISHMIPVISEMSQPKFAT
jgi:hypothetical protein